MVNSFFQMMMRVSTVINWFIFVINGMFFMMMITMVRLLVVIINVTGVNAIFLMGIFVGIFKVIRWMFLNMMIRMFPRIGFFMVIIVRMMMIVRILVRIIVRIKVWIKVRIRVMIIM